MTRALTVFVTVVVVTVAASLQQAAGSLSSADHGSAGELCKLKGTRYAGRTSQGKPVCFTVRKTGGAISEYAYGYRDSCGAGTARTTTKNGITITSNGSFKSTFSESFFKGRIAGTKATGTLRSKRTEYGFVPPVTCDSGVARWSATRKN